MTTFTLIAFVLAQLADVITTERGLRKGGFEEANDFIAYLMTNLGRGWIILKLAFASVIAYVLYDNDSLEGLWIVTLVTGYFAYRNLKITR